MSKLHELLAAEKTPNAAWNQVYGDTMKKFKSAAHYFEGHSKSLHMLEETAVNEVIEAQAREEKPVTTTVYDTLEYAFEIYSQAENLQFQKNLTNQRAKATVNFRGEEILTNIPVDELLGLESRLLRIRDLIIEMPTLDATKHWEIASSLGNHIWQVKFPEETTKTEKLSVPVVLSEATENHPAQVQVVNKDVVIGKNTLVRRSGAATALQKAECIKVIDTLLVECKKARMRANETEVSNDEIASTIVNLILKPFEL